MPTMTDDLNSTATRADIPGEVYPEGELPTFGGAGRATLPPGEYTFRMPMELPSLWHDLLVTIDGQQLKHSQLKFDKDHPLVVVGGPEDGAPMLASFSTMARARNKDKTVVVSDLAYLLENCLGDASRPMRLGGEQAQMAIKAAINKAAGRTIRLRTGLGAQCRPDKVRWTFKDEQSTASQPDPSGQHGCGQRHYDRDFKVPGSKPVQYDNVIACKKCGAAVRGYESVEAFLAPSAVPF